MISEGNHPQMAQIALFQGSGHILILPDYWTSNWTSNWTRNPTIKLIKPSFFASSFWTLEGLPDAIEVVLFVFGEISEFADVCIYSYV